MELVLTPKLLIVITLCMAQYVYKLTNKVNGKIYIGKTNNLKRRWIEHLSESKRERKNQSLYNAINKYGFDNFSISVLGEYLTESEAFDAEVLFIKELKSTERGVGYNCTLGGDGVRGVTDECRRKISAQASLRLGPKNSFFGHSHTEATKAKLSKARSLYVGERHPMWGRHQSLSAKKSISMKKARLTEDQVRDLRLRHGLGDDLCALASTFGLSRRSAWDVVKGFTYRWVL